MHSPSFARPLILLTNDDGVSAPGLQALAQALEEVGEVVVVAPDTNRSGVAHKISLVEPIRVRELGPGRSSIDGTPADCVYLAVVELLPPRRPALVVSGINAGPNLSHDVHYSGTVGAAVEGTLFEIPSIAVSLTDAHKSSYEPAARFTRDLAERVLAGGLPVGTTLNVNVPPGEPKGYQMTYLGHRSYRHSVHRRIDPRGQPYFWIGGMPDHPRDLAGSDCDAVLRGLISVTPLTIDMTDQGALSGSLGRLEVPRWQPEAPVLGPASRREYDPAADGFGREHEP